MRYELSSDCSFAIVPRYQIVFGQDSAEIARTFYPLRLQKIDKRLISVYLECTR